jgi:hypothetical protein
LQLSIATPQTRAPHGSGAGVQPQVLAVHACPPSQPPQSIGFPQLSVILSQRPSHQVGSGAQTHWSVFGSHEDPAAQLSAQDRFAPQLSRLGPQCDWHQVGSD